MANPNSALNNKSCEGGTVQTNSSYDPMSESDKECAYWSSGLEVDESDKLWADCKKNPGHKKFIPVGDFRLDHLPPKLQTKEWFDFIKGWSDLTVRLRVSFKTADGKPDFRLGTGFVLHVEPTDGQTGQRSSTFYLQTAKHVIDDNSDFQSMMVDFYHNDKEGKMKTLKGGSVIKTDDETDWRLFTCLCQDEELAEHMMRQEKETDRLWESLGKWFGSLSPKPVIFISHPHGGPKYVTVGEFAECDWFKKKFSYTTDTCPGSSGSRMVGWGLWGPHHSRRGEGRLNEGFFNWLVG